MRRDLERVRRAVEMAAPAVGPQTVADAIAVGRLEDGLNLADHITDPIDRARVLAALASVILQAGREEDAGRVVDEIRRGIEGRLSGMEHVDLLIELAHALWMDPLPEASAKHGLLLKLLDAAAGASAKLGSPHDRATALIKLGEAYRQAGRIDRAERCNLDALELTRATKDLAGEAAVLDCLGLIYSERGQGKNATESYERALKLYQRVGNDEGKATVLEHLGEVQERLGNNRLAQTYYEQALSLLRQSGDRSGEAAMLGNIDRVNAKIGGKSNVSPTRQKPNEAYPIGKGEQFDRPSKSVASSTGSLIPRFFIVKEEERAVIYRRGRFHRIDGPGWVFLRPFETVQRMLLVRDQPRTASVAQLFLYGIPIGFTLSFWARVDPVAAAGGDAVRLKDMAMFEDYERDQQVDLKIRDSFVHRVSELEKNRPLSNHATIIDKIIPILPGSPECDWLLNQVRGDLTRTLPLVGVFLNTRHPITLNGIIAPKEMIEGFSRGRMQELLRLYFPKLPADRLAQMVESIEGLETMGRYDFDQKGSAAQQVVPDKKTGDDAGGMKVVRSSLLRLQLASAEPPAAESIPEELTKHDLSYLRSVPRAAAAKA
jgi:tetratricopeptide (TPR) repeat protein